MIAVRRSGERGHAQHGWLESFHTFSFAGYHDPRHMGFRDLRVINEDRVRPGRGFDAHSHRDMEIVTFVIEGELEHQDSLGNGSVIRAGDVQRMSAGTGVTHSEYNPSSSDPVHFLQIWILPDREGIAPSYEQRRFGAEDRRGVLRPIASPDGRDGSLRIHQDVEILASLIEPGKPVALELAAGRHAWLQMIRGEVEMAGHRLAAGDGAACSDETRLRIDPRETSELLLFDLA